jgi:DNA-binding NarL/FixJ family response regulator
MRIRVLIADDHQILRQGLRAMLEKEPNIEVVGEVENGRAAVQMAKKLAPHVVLMDVAMPDLNGLDATRQIRNESPKVKVIALSMHDDRRFVLNMLKCGASGYLLKDCAFKEILQAIHSVMDDRSYLSLGITDHVVKGLVYGSPGDGATAFSLLTPREREVLQLIAEGNSTQKIADMLYVSMKTVETHRVTMMNKLNIFNVAQLTKYAISEGLTSVKLSSPSSQEAVAGKAAGSSP